MVRAARREKRWEEVEQHATALLDREPDNAYALGWLAEAHEKQGHLDLATACYERALELDAGQHAPVAATVYRRLGILYNKAGRYDDCQRVCARYTERYPESSDAWNRLSRAAGNTGDADLCLSAGMEADAIRSEREYAEQVRRARGARLLALYEARLAELGYGPDEGDDREDQPPMPGPSREQPGVWLNTPTAAGHDAWLARERALMDAIHQLLREEAEQREAEI
jgi:predicted Zn-dependent protease